MLSVAFPHLMRFWIGVIPVLVAYIFAGTIWFGNYAEWVSLKT